MKKPRIIKSEREAIRCLGSLKVLFEMLDEYTQVCLEVLEVIEEECTELTAFLGQSYSKILKMSTNSAIICYSKDENIVEGEILFSKIGHYADMIADLLDDELAKRSN